VVHEARGSSGVEQAFAIANRPAGRGPLEISQILLSKTCDPLTSLLVARPRTTHGRRGGAEAHMSRTVGVTYRLLSVLDLLLLVVLAPVGVKLALAVIFT
jgi:hypothetical protein